VLGGLDDDDASTSSCASQYGMIGADAIMEKHTDFQRLKDEIMRGTAGKATGQ
jgi:hypothetical protein